MQMQIHYLVQELGLFIELDGKFGLYMRIVMAIGEGNEKKKGRVNAPLKGTQNGANEWQCGTCSNIY